MAFDFRQLHISFPKNKFIARTANVNILIAEGRTITKEIGMTICHLRHLVLVVLGVHHFLSRL